MKSKFVNGTDKTNNAGYYSYTFSQIIIYNFVYSGGSSVNVIIS
jgi:hypothetical protein